MNAKRVQFQKKANKIIIRCTTKSLVDQDQKKSIEPDYYELINEL